ncbi:hypothetical protein CVT25_010920 [Psilocybe cyanescens]|uniref:Uncharacterized protein n=1 Tax=Psilocybe cyanescens TaxID=93625 RepID=A0A409WFL7_PSICY|nr:hypothetical protein CVT25_010920 [Psilocybe cyanescens]
MRPKHTQHPLPAFPVYSCAFLSQTEMVLGGGGGASRSGIKNKLRLYNVGDNRSIELKDEYELERGEDAPMSMAAHRETGIIICGVNSVEEKLLKGENENCRTFSTNAAKYVHFSFFAIMKEIFIFNHRIKPLTTINTIPVSVQVHLTPSPHDINGSVESYGVVAGWNPLTLLSFPSLRPIADTIHVEKDIYDASFSDNNLVITTTHNLFVYGLPTTTLPKSPTTTSPKKSKKKSKAATNEPNEKLLTLELQKSVDVPSSTGEGSTFRVGRYHPQNDKVFYTVINVVPPRSRKSKSLSRQAFICKWNTTTWTLEKSRKVGDGGLTCVDLSPDGRFIGYGFSDLTIGMLDTKTLSPLASILKAHEFPPTIVKFNLESTLLVSGSPDNSIRIVTIPNDAAGSSFTTIVMVLLAILVLLLAVAVRLYPGGISL